MDGNGTGLVVAHAPKRDRTSNHLVRSQVLYPIELSVQGRNGSIEGLFLALVFMDFD